MSAQVSLRFYEELNDYLPPQRRKVTFDHTINERDSMGAVLEAVAVPAEAVDLVLVNGASVGLDHRLHDGDRVSVYPVFERFDVREHARLPGRPLRQPRFVLDSHLGKLAVYLRMLGFDALYERKYRDAELAAIAGARGRILLTVDRGLLERRAVTRGYRVAATRPRAQLVEVLTQFDLAGTATPFRRCLRCNALVEQVPKEAVTHRVPVRVRAEYERFWVCPDCGRVYWKGSHYRRMRRFVQKVLERAREQALAGE